MEMEWNGNEILMKQKWKVAQITQDWKKKNFLAEGTVSTTWR